MQKVKTVYIDPNKIAKHTDQVSKYIHRLLHASTTVERPFYCHPTITDLGWMDGSIGNRWPNLMLYIQILKRHLTKCPIHGHKRLDDDAFLASLSHSRKATVSRADVPRCRPVETLKNRLQTTSACLTVASKQESCRYSMSSSLWHQIWAIWL